MMSCHDHVFLDGTNDFVRVVGIPQKMIVFFDIKGVIMTEWVPRGQTVNPHYYLQVPTTLRERALWQNDSWMLH